MNQESDTPLTWGNVVQLAAEEAWQVIEQNLRRGDEHLEEARYHEALICADRALAEWDECYNAWEMRGMALLSLAEIDTNESLGQQVFPFDGEVLRLTAGRALVKAATLKSRLSPSDGSV